MMSVAQKSFARALLCALGLAGLASVQDGGAFRFASSAYARENKIPNELKHVGVNEHIGNNVPRNLSFQDHLGNRVTTATLFDGQRPVLFNLVYYTCPMLCSLVLDATLKAMKGIGWTVGREYDVWVVSIDPKDTPERAARKRAEVMERYGRAKQSAGWHFWVGDESNIRLLAETVGFEYKYDDAQKQYAHPAVTMLLSPNGKVARYLYGIEIKPDDLKLGLFEASGGRFMRSIEKLILYCYHYNPQEGRYVLMASRIMKVGGLFSALILIGLLSRLWRKEWVRSASDLSNVVG